MKKGSQMSFGMIFAYCTNLAFWGIGIYNTRGKPIMVVPVIIFIIFFGLLMYSIIKDVISSELENRG